MTDVFDRASECEDVHRADALRAQALRAGLTGKTVADSATECRICTEAIPSKRRAALPGVQTCVPCQEESEIALRGGGQIKTP